MNVFGVCSKALEILTLRRFNGENNTGLAQFRAEKGIFIFKVAVALLGGG